VCKEEVYLRVGLTLIASVTAAACSNPEPRDSELTASPESPGSEATGGGGGHSAQPEPDSGDAGGANVVAVRTSGSAGAYHFAVTLESPDTGCDRYADWWEVITPDGVLVYRRILAHSHADEQPFTRSGGPIDVQPTARVIVRAHMNDAGYGGTAFSGSSESGFAADPSVTAELAPELAKKSPLPNGCAF
jgi:hypothetical protein